MKRREFVKAVEVAFAMFAFIVLHPQALGAVQKLNHRGARFERTKTGIPERIYSELWQKTNERWPSLNYGHGILEIILQDSDEWQPVSERDAFVAATVIQWLGTNVGGGFLWEAERRIKEEYGQGMTIQPR